MIYKTSPYDRYDEQGVLPGAPAEASLSPTGRAQILARLESAHLQNQRTIRQVQRVLERSSLDVTERQQPTKREAAGVEPQSVVGFLRFQARGASMALSRCDLAGCVLCRV